VQERFVIEVREDAEIAGRKTGRQEERKLSQRPNIQLLVIRCVIRDAKLNTITSAVLL